MSTEHSDPFAFGAAGEHADPVAQAHARWRATIAGEPAGEDAELLAMIAEEQALSEIADRLDDDENSAEAKRYYRLAEALEAKIQKTPARTIGGVVALLEHDSQDTDELALESLREIERRAMVIAPIAAAPVKLMPLADYIAGVGIESFSFGLVLAARR